MKIHCINLERATERKAQILKDWEGYDIEFFPAIDRRNLKDDYNPEATIKHLQRPLTDGERACCYSHINLLEKFLASNETHFIVIEDDAKPLVDINEFEQIINQCKNRKNQKEIFLLFEHYGMGKFDNKKIDENFFMFNGENLWGTCGMLFTRIGATIMLRYLKSMIGPADYYWPFIAKMGVLVRYKKPLIRHIGVFSTYIEKTYRGESEKSKKFMK
jgi:glycosyl transferase family 25